MKTSLCTTLSIQISGSDKEEGKIVVERKGRMAGGEGARPTL